jgi:hypothetical protein
MTRPWLWIVLALVALGALNYCTAGLGQELTTWKTQKARSLTRGLR